MFLAYFELDEGAGTIFQPALVGAHHTTTGDVFEAGIKRSWHHREIDYDDLTVVQTLQPGRLEVVRHPDFGNTSVLVKLGPDGYEADMHRETEFYRILDGLGTTPLFLGHITRGDRIVGFVSEYIIAEGKSAAVGTQTGRKKAACLAALRRMHANGVAHRDAHGGNCLLRENGTAVLIDFELSVVNPSQAQVAKDLWVMSHTVQIEGA
ncbi:hypothetical protein M406DRAFT_327044 [Cryphonectria parasitica EP155]|uniref:Aminoglycoside phosphotransferase domain-containing protein n=1 Tax=Cryphonectria parasitica (strain ATCC 38755 / EP155) TaxID=660469 RepID=A0A9P5CSH8_CRYP1|nr:uncharacterized protein M406DRAFT_327044 [Cryphonectria parasitica EP155]KAF3768617.1 hypothetical protein M406DRAFT_327044 [Cryphonectria parasitica EP155]